MASGLFFPEPDMRNTNDSQGSITCRAVQRVWFSPAPDADAEALVVGRNNNGTCGQSRVRGQARQTDRRKALLEVQEPGQTR